MAKSINISKISDAHADLMHADLMVDRCDPKIIDIFCKLNVFLDENKESQETKEYKFIAKDTQRIKNEFINNCMIKK
jgi:hypothetical protein